jgi:hypothetical protein
VATKQAQKGTWVSIELSPETNALLEAAMKASCRTKRAECGLRLKDHLEEFKTVDVLPHLKEGASTLKSKACPLRASAALDPSLKVRGFEQTLFRSL